MTFKKRLRKESAYYALLLFLYLGYLFPPGFTLLFGRVLGHIAFFFLKKPLRKMRCHIRIAFKDRFSSEEIDLLCLRNFEHWGTTLFEVVNLLKVHRIEDLKRKVRVHNIELLESNLRSDRGIILLTPHLGNWEVTAAALSLFGYKFAVLAKEVYDLRLNNVILKVRGGRKIINIPRDSIITAIKYLKQGYILGILPDQATDVSGIYIDFFGKPAYTPTGPAKLSIKTGIPILLFYNYRDSLGRINIVFDKFIEKEYSDEEELTKVWSRYFEEYITRYPEQWVWMHERWKKI
ncbi:MAG: lysophospholipid acyltransferase family protein [bacterium]|nr:lysophospholipid acyltransferase family protein [bacterium]